MAKMPHILVIDDDDRLRSLLSRYLNEQGFEVSVAASAALAREKMRTEVYDALVLDIMMQGETGLQFAASLQAPHPPVLLLSAMGEANDRIRGLEAGAEDYLTKPFEPRELVLRLNRLLRRVSEAPAPKRHLHFGPYRFELESGRLWQNDQPVALTSNETAMLKLLAERAPLPVSRELLANATLAPGNERSVDVQITRLRKKLDTADAPSAIQTVRHAGYALVT